MRPAIVLAALILLGFACKKDKSQTLRTDMRARADSLLFTGVAMQCEGEDLDSDGCGAADAGPFACAGGGHVVMCPRDAVDPCELVTPLVNRPVEATP